MISPEDRKRTKRFCQGRNGVHYGGVVRFVVVFYLLMGLAAQGLIHWRVDEDAPFDPYGLGGPDWPYYLLSAVTLVLAVHAGSLWAIKWWPALRRGVREMRRWLGGLSTARIFILALASGVAEELLFRGWLLNEIGLLGSSLVFGLVHIPPNRDWLYWPVFAFFMGLVLGGLCLWSNSLVYAALAHVGINFINLLRLAPGSEDAGPFSARQPGPH